MVQFKLIDNNGETLMKFDPSDDIGDIMAEFQMCIQSYVISTLDLQDPIAIGRERKIVDPKDDGPTLQTDFSLSDESDNDPDLDTYTIKVGDDIIGTVKALSIKKASKLAHKQFFSEETDFGFSVIHTEEASPGKITYGEKKKYIIDNDGILCKK